MSAFNENAGRTWTVAVNVDAVNRVRSLSVVNLGCELIWALMVGPIPLSLLDRPLPVAPDNTL